MQKYAHIVIHDAVGRVISFARNIIGCVGLPGYVDE